MILLFSRKNELFPLERLAYAWGIGVGILTLQMYFFAKIGIRLTIPNIAIPSFFFFACLAAYSLYKKGVFFDAHGLLGQVKGVFSADKKEGLVRVLAEKILIAWIGLKLLYIFFEALIKPVVAWDALAHWSFTAKVFFVERTIPSFLMQISGANAHSNTQLCPLLQAWLYISMGTWNEIMSKIIFPIFFAAMLLIFYYVIRREQSRLKSLLFTFFLSSLPLLAYHSTIEYADIAVAFYTLAAVLMLLRFFNVLDLKFLWGSALLFSLSYFSKEEGMFYSFAAFVILCSFMILNKNFTERFDRKKLMILLGAGFTALTMYIVYLLFFQKIGIWQGIFWGRLPGIHDIFLSKMFFSGNWNITWTAFIAAVFYRFLRGGRGRCSYLLALILLILSMFVAYYLMAHEGVDVWLHDGTVLSRNFLQFAPIIIFYIAAQMGAALEGVKPSFPEAKTRKTRNST